MPVLTGGQVLAGGAAITDLAATAGTADDTVVDVGAAFAQTTLNDNFRDVTAKINAIITALENAGIVVKV